MGRGGKLQPPGSVTAWDLLSSELVRLGESGERLVAELKDNDV